MKVLSLSPLWRKSTGLSRSIDSYDRLADFNNLSSGRVGRTSRGKSSTADLLTGHIKSTSEFNYWEDQLKFLRKGVIWHHEVRVGSSIIYARP